eukprot:c20888_g1_i1.p1 GENE.c20888_g1_i1~~c20888_g1_i1.p1  ORF type:complete len:442 (+),score=120.14 c20888_g1_i1:63-1388(+)
MKSACTFLNLFGIDGEYSRSFPDWTSSFCLLGQGKISCFEIDPRTAPKGKIPLDKAQVSASEKNVAGSQYSATECFKITTPDRVYHIFAETHDNRNKWVSLLNSHIARVKSGSFDPPANFQLRDQIVSAERVEYLTKSGGLRDLSWKRRLFVLNAGFLVYYELPPGLRSKGNIVCLNCTDAPDAPVPTHFDKKAVIKVQAERGSLYIAASSLIDKERWKAALNVSNTNDSLAEPPSNSNNSGGANGSGAPSGQEATGNQTEPDFYAPPTELPENEVIEQPSISSHPSIKENPRTSTVEDEQNPGFATDSMSPEDEKALGDLRDILNKYDLGRFLRAFISQGFTSVVTLKHLTPDHLTRLADENNLSPAHRAQLSEFYAFHNLLAKNNLENFMLAFLAEGCDKATTIADLDEEDVNHFAGQAGLGRFDVKKLKKMVEDLKAQ